MVLVKMRFNTKQDSRQQINHATLGKMLDFSEIKTTKFSLSMNFQHPHIFYVSRWLISFSIYQGLSTRIISCNYFVKPVSYPRIS